MLRNILLFLALAAAPSAALAQDDLFGDLGQTKTERHGFVIGFNGNLDFPAADMAQRFGISYRVGPSVFYKTKNNWMLGVKTDFLLSGNIREDSLLINIRNSRGNFINQDGQEEGIGRFMRGYMIGVQAGKIIPLKASRPHQGIMIMTGAGFMQHKISLVNRDKTIPQLRGDYRKGYDRLTNGLYVEQFVGFNHFDPRGYLNFYAGLDVVAGFTQGRRDFLFDVMRTDDQARTDILFGIRAGWYLPIFKRKSEEIYF